MNRRFRTISVHVFAFALVSAVLFATALLPALQQFAELTALANGGRSVSGKVMSTQCTEHGQVSYEFAVGGRTFHRTSNSCGISCGLLAPGSSVSVRYL